MNFQTLIQTLQDFWSKQGCLLIQPFDVEKGAGTFNPATFFRALGPEPFSAAYVEPCRRPTDGRYGENPLRTQHYFQFQVMMKPSPDNIVQLYLDSLKAIGISPDEHDIRFVHDDWETAALGAWGLGWEVWCDGTEVTQFTYFQQVAGYELGPITGEITYGLERLCMFLQGVDNFFDMQYNDTFTYGDMFHQNEIQYSRHNFEIADISLHRNLFDKFEDSCKALVTSETPIPALDYLIKCSHAFNILDARKAISVNERQGYVMRLQTLAKAVAGAWLQNRKSLGHPLLSKTRSETNTAQVVKHLTPTDSIHTSQPLLIELGVEEMPAKVFKPLLKQLPGLIKKHFDKLKLHYEPFEVYVTPRRIAIFSPAIQTKQEDKVLELKGPPIAIARNDAGEWTKAALGFAKKNGLELSELQTKKFGKAEYLFATKNEKGKYTSDTLSKTIPTLLSDIHWYKTMRWSQGTQTPFVRPVRWFVALLGESVIPAQFCDVEAGNCSFGHRFLHNKPIEVSIGTYAQQLEKASVILNHDKRKKTIREATKRIAEENGYTWRKDEELLDHVTFLVEYPVPILGRFDQRFLEMPEEVLVSEMREHQKYFALQKPDGSLANAFIAISNMSFDNSETVQKGNEAVLVSRLRDGEFFLKDDRKTTLASRRQTLETLTFERSLGSVGQKVERIIQLSKWLCEITGQDSKFTSNVIQASELCKNDLTTAMVFEFPDLQGEMGRYYAQKEGYDTPIPDAIKDHYYPRFANDACPITLEGAYIALADRMDSIAGLFGVGKIPTGSADPFALRRCALAILAIILNKNISIDLNAFIQKAITVYSPGVFKSSVSDLASSISEFFLGRLKIMLQESRRPDIPGGFRYDSIDAVIGSQSSWAQITDTTARIVALTDFRANSEFSDIATTFKRVGNILEAEIKGEINPDLLVLDSEKALIRAIENSECKISDAVKHNRYSDAFKTLAEFKPFVDALFNEAMINDKDDAIKQNRHLLLKRVRNISVKIADFSAIQE